MTCSEMIVQVLSGYGASGGDTKDEIAGLIDRHLHVKVSVVTVARRLNYLCKAKNPKVLVGWAYDGHGHILHYKKFMIALNPSPQPEDGKTGQLQLAPGHTAEERP